MREILLATLLSFTLFTGCTNHSLIKQERLAIINQERIDSRNIHIDIVENTLFFQYVLKDIMNSIGGLKDKYIDHAVIVASFTVYSEYDKRYDIWSIPSEEIASIARWMVIYKHCKLEEDYKKLKGTNRFTYTDELCVDYTK